MVKSADIILNVVDFRSIFTTTALSCQPKSGTVRTKDFPMCGGC